MKKLIATIIGTVAMIIAVATSYSQGTLFLNNNDSGFGIFISGTTPAPVGTMVQVLAGPNAGSLVPIFNATASPTSVFTVGVNEVNSNGPNSGSFFDGTYGHANNIAPITVGFVQVIAWTGAATYALAQTTPGAYWGQSPVFSQIFGTSPTMPPTMVNPTVLALPGPIIFLPEPTTITIGGLGVAALWCLRRKK